MLGLFSVSLSRQRVELEISVLQIQKCHVAMSKLLSLQVHEHNNKMLALGMQMLGR